MTELPADSIIYFGRRRIRSVPRLFEHRFEVQLNRRPFLIGEAAPAGELPFRGRSGKRVADLLGVSLDEMHLFLEARNLLPERPTRPVGSAGKGDGFPVAEAKAAASSIVLGGRRAILAGKRVGRAFGLPARAKFLDEVDLRGGRVLLLPHPSGIVLWWNSKENRERAASAIRRFVFEDPSKVKEIKR